MDSPNCNGCQLRDALIERLHLRVADLEAKLAQQQQTIQRLEATVRRLTDRLAQYEPEVRRESTARDTGFANLVAELIRLVLADELFTFVLEPEVEATNNGMERLLRGPALDRKAGRTNQTAAGAHRRSVIVSVLESLRANLERFDLPSVLAEVARWLSEGISLFGRQWEEAQAGQAAAATAVPNTS